MGGAFVEKQKLQGSGWVIEEEIDGPRKI